MGSFTGVTLAVFHALLSPAASLPSTIATPPLRSTPVYNVSASGRAAMIGGVAGLTSLVVVLAGEISQGESFMGTDLAAITGFLGFLGACLLVLGLVGVNVRYSASLGKVGQAA